MNISSAVFDCSAPDLDSCPDESLPEFAFIGRSNVGKSSLLNMLTGKRDLAKVSPTPGHTKLINMFTINDAWRLVDLPGYGFAQVARKDRSRFNRSVAEYLQQRENLCCVFTLIDSGLPPQKLDIEFVGWLVDNAVPFVLVFTKVDRVSAATVQSNIAAFTEAISAWCDKLPEVFTTSSTTSHGRPELLRLINEVVAAVRDEAANDPEQSAATGPATSAAPAKPGRSKARVSRPNPARPW